MDGAEVASGSIHLERLKLTSASPRTFLAPSVAGAPCGVKGGDRNFTVIDAK